MEEVEALKVEREGEFVIVTIPKWSHAGEFFVKASVGDADKLLVILDNQR